MSLTSLPTPNLTLHIWVLHEHQETITQGRADCLGARKEKVQRGQNQVLQVELCIGMLLLLQREVASGQTHCPHALRTLLGFPPGPTSYRSGPMMRRGTLVLPGLFPDGWLYPNVLHTLLTQLIICSLITHLVVAF